MRRTQRATRTEAGQPAAVYLIHRIDRRRFKLGWAFDPLRRAMTLPEFPRGELDLRGSCALWLSNRRRALQVERAMHKGLAPYHVAAGHHGDGHSEWFAPTALPSALQLLRQMPSDDPAGGAQSAPLRPLLMDQPEIVWAEVDQSPQDVWYGVEDLWLRLAAELPVRAEADGPLWRVVVQGFRHARDGRMPELRCRALDTEVFTWRVNGQCGAFVRLIAYEADDLVFTVSPLSAMERWPQAQGVGWQVRGLLARLRSTGQARPSAASGAVSREGANADA
jgi:hypothetical protein